jgi:hypothetical protein
MTYCYTGEQDCQLGAGKEGEYEGYFYGAKRDEPGRTPMAARAGDWSFADRLKLPDGGYR